MTTTVAELAALASQLLKTEDGRALDEATLRCSASRAYYAALHAADRSLPEDLVVTGEAKRGQSSHKAIIDAVVLWAKSVRPGRQDAIAVARGLPRLRDARKKADYHLDLDFTLEAAQEALKLSTDVIDSAARAAQRSLIKQA